MTIPALPPSIKHGAITGQILGIIADTALDPDNNPDAVALQDLDITIAPDVTIVRDPVAKVIYTPQPFTLRSDTEGYIRYPQDVDLQGNLLPGAADEIRLVATEDESKTPASWTWTMRITSRMLKAELLFPFHVEPDSTQDISEFAPVKQSNGQYIMRGVTGPPPELVAGTTTDLPPESEPTFDLVETSPGVYRVDVGLRQGQEGLPGAPGGSDAATASWITGGTDTPAALESWLAEQDIEAPIEAAPQVEYRPLWVTGHSWVDGVTDAAQWWQRIAARSSSPSTVMAGYSGRTVGDVAMLDLAGTTKWTPRTRAFVLACCTINDLTLFQGTAASRRGYGHAWRSILSQVTANAIIAANTVDVVYSPGWTKTSVSRTTGQGASRDSTGGEQFTTTTVGSYCEFAVTGPSVDVVVVARAAGAGLVTFTTGSTTLGTLDLTLTTAQDTPAVARLRGMGAGTRTIRATFTSGSSMTLDSIRIPLANPTSGVIVGEPNITATNYGNYIADLTSFKADLAAILADYPTFRFCDLATKAGFTAATMLYDGKHPSDIGADWIAQHVLATARDTPWTAGLHKIATAPDAEYVKPTPPSVPSGGQPGAGAVPPIMTDTPDYTGTTDTGGLTWDSVFGGTPAAYEHTYNTVETGQANVIVKATLSAIDADAAPGIVCGGIACRVSDINNGIHLSVRTDTYAFTRFNAGTHTTLNASSGVVPAVGDVIELRSTGNHVMCWVNGVNIMEHTNLTGNATATKHGFMTTATTGDTAFSDISITPF